MGTFLKNGKRYYTTTTDVAFKSILCNIFYINNPIISLWLKWYHTFVFYASIFDNKIKFFVKIRLIFGLVSAYFRLILIF